MKSVDIYKFAQNEHNIHEVVWLNNEKFIDTKSWDPFELCVRTF